ncbi:hypothetical protein RHGRI_022876 [Rhododendron griersonianum]|uniref:Uncharacterized protein n=1 Tax=Rhododendron griersonianum TaxID=479676 RepID=A0AAV6J144_9ERIC|nr:hypothetical protein RHGRI_022876 [Rhododendron griersonianum]
MIYSSCTTISVSHQGGLISHHHTEGETKLWDICGDGFDSMEGAGLLKIASLSLDEPETNLMKVRVVVLRTSFCVSLPFGLKQWFVP